MRGDAQVIARLNQALQEELTAINQYFVHAEMLHNWGYHKLGAYIRKQSIDEMKHAEKLLERVLFLDGTPIMRIRRLAPLSGALLNGRKFNATGVLQRRNAGFAF